MDHPDATLARGHLRNLAMDTMSRLDELLGSHDEDVPRMIDAVSQVVVDYLTYASIFTDEGTAARLAEDGAHRALRVAGNVEPEFWLTDLGRLIARHIGYGKPVVPRAHAAAILGVTKQRIYQLEKSGQLEQERSAAGTSGICNVSLLRRLREAPGRG